MKVLSLLEGKDAKRVSATNSGCDLSCDHDCDTESDHGCDWK